MLRISRDEENKATEVNFNLFTGLRRCPSVADLFELNRVERTRLEHDTGIQVDDGIID
jgi:hypothetical protein